MSLFSIFARLFRRTDAAPPSFDVEFMPAGLERPDPPETVHLLHEVAEAEAPRAPLEEKDVTGRPAQLEAWSQSLHRIDEDVFGISFGIEYLDASGSSSRRRITLRHTYKSDDGIVYVRCYCHERKAPRTFRFDRITTVIDLDGVIHNPAAFFRDELQLDFEVLPEAAQEQPPDSPRRSQVAPTAQGKKPGYAQRHIARDGLRVLVALSRADAELHPKEVEAILRYILTKSDQAGIATDEVDRAALLGYLRRQYPSAEVVRECLSRLECEPEEDRRLFLRSALAVMDADGIQRPAEFDIVLDLQNRLAEPANAGG